MCSTRGVAELHNSSWVDRIAEAIGSSCRVITVNRFHYPTERRSDGVDWTAPGNDVPVVHAVMHTDLEGATGSQLLQRHRNGSGPLLAATSAGEYPRHACLAQDRHDVVQAKVCIDQKSVVVLGNTLDRPSVCDRILG